MEQLLASLRRFDALRDSPGDGRYDTVHVRMQPAQPPTFAPNEDLERLLGPLLRQALQILGIDALYVHQAQAIDYIRKGHDVVLEAPTGSGKTLCFNIPVALALLDNPKSHVLVVHPMKALSNDQRKQFNDLANALEKASRRRLESWIFDGDLDRDSRRLLKETPPQVLFTNPDMLHQSFLGWQEQWLTFLSGLKMVILDEIHEYRGYFGTNVALLLRRFFARLSQLGVPPPQVVLATATCGNAQEHAERLTGRRCTLVRAQTGMRPERHFAFINPDIPDFRYYDIYLLRIARAALACLDQKLSTLIFCPSRRFAEEAAIRAKRDAPDFGIDPETIAPYRSGYDSDQRRDIENGLRSGRYKAVFSTNALELGIDIGKLDVCILAGFPDSVLSAWQRIGRVGRHWKKKAYVLFYAFNNPFDRFFASNIDVFLDKPLDHILISLDNEELMRRHLKYLVHESGGELSPKLAQHLGQTFLDFARKEINGKKPARNKPRYQDLSIRGGGGTVYKLKYKGKDLGEISELHRFREAYVGAIYNHFGKPYRVIAHGANEVELDDVEPHLRTEGIFYTVTQETDMLAGFRSSETLAACYGRLTIYENFAGYREIDTRSGDVVSEQRSETARVSNVRGFWLEVTDLAILGQGKTAKDLVGIEQLLRIGAPFVLPCDRHDIGTCLTMKEPPRVYLYETVPGGIGVAEKMLSEWPTVIETAIAIAEKCQCKHGCPSCLLPSRLPSDFPEPKKGPTIEIGRQFLLAASAGRRERFDATSHAWAPES